MQLMLSGAGRIRVGRCIPADARRDNYIHVRCVNRASRIKAFTVKERLVGQAPVLPEAAANALTMGPRSDLRSQPTDADNDQEDALAR